MVSDLSQPPCTLVANPVSLSQTGQLDSLLQIFIDRNPLAVIYWNIGFEVVEWNPAAERIFGYQRQEAIGHHAADLIIPQAWRSACDQIFQELLGQEAGNHSINQNITQSGQVITCEWHNTPLLVDGQVVGVLSMAQDVSELKAAETALAESEAKFRRLVEDANSIIFTTDLEGRFTYLSPGFIEILGYNVDDYLGHTFAEIVHPEDSQACFAAIQTIFVTGKRGLGPEFRAQRKDGTWCWLVSHNSPNRNAEGQILGLHGVARDVSDRKQIEQEQARLLAILEATPDLVGTISPTGEVLYVNRAGRRIIGISEDASLTRQTIAQWHPAWAMEKLMTQGIPDAIQCGTWSGETAFLDADGTEVPISQVVLAWLTDKSFGEEAENII